MRFSKINVSQIKHFSENLKKIGKPIKKFKFGSLVIRLQLTPLVGFLPVVEKIQGAAGIFEK